MKYNFQEIEAWNDWNPKKNLRKKIGRGIYIPWKFSRLISFVSFVKLNAHTCWYFFYLGGGKSLAEHAKVPFLGNQS